MATAGWSRSSGGVEPPKLYGYRMEDVVERAALGEDRA
jgi:hypothetical protein